MVVEHLLTGSRWEILQELARKPQSTSHLAKALKTTSANVSQQLKQLEIAGIIARKRAQGKRVHYTYSIAKDVLHYIHVSPQIATKKSFTTDPLRTFIAALTTLPNSMPLLTLILARPELVKRFTAIGVLKRPKPELFVLAEHVDDIRQQHANITIPTLDGDQTIVLWSHTVQEVQEGIKRKDNYFSEALSHITLAYDPDNTLQELKQLAGDNK